jgi:hypothetical protein
MAIAYRVLAQMIAQKVVLASWSDAKPLDTLQQERDGHSEWVMSFVNWAIERTGQQGALHLPHGQWTVHRRQLHGP